MNGDSTAVGMSLTLPVLLGERQVLVDAPVLGSNLVGGQRSDGAGWGPCRPEHHHRQPTDGYRPEDAGGVGDVGAGMDGGLGEHGVTYPAVRWAELTG